MPKYVYIYKGTGMAETEEAQQAAMAAWGAFLGGLGESLVDPGNPFGPSALVGDGSGSSLTGYSIVTADSLDQATERAKGCPALGAGGSVEVYETIEISM